MFTVCTEDDIRSKLIAMRVGVYVLNACIEYPDTKTVASLPITKIDDVNHIFAPTTETDTDKTCTLDQALSFVTREFKNTFKNGAYGNLTSRRLANSLNEYLITKPRLNDFDDIEDIFGDIFDHPEKFIDILSDGIYRIRGTTKVARSNPRILFIKHDNILQRIDESEDGSWSLVNQSSKSLIAEAIIRFGGEYDIKAINIPK